MEEVLTPNTLTCTAPPLHCYRSALYRRGDIECCYEQKLPDVGAHNTNTHRAEEPEHEHCNDIPYGKVLSGNVYIAEKSTLRRTTCDLSQLETSAENDITIHGTIHNKHDNTDLKKEFQLNSDRGRHLIAKSYIEKRRMIFVERPLLSLQSLENFAEGVRCCHHCKAFVGTADTSLSYLVHGKKDSGGNEDQQPQQKQRQLIEKDVSGQETTIDKDAFRDSGQYQLFDEGSHKNLVECRDTCGYVYCSTECERAAWGSYHRCLCTGKIHCVQHPLVLFKQYCVQTNEILLLIAEWWIAEHMCCTGSYACNDMARFEKQPWQKPETQEHMFTYNIWNGADQDILFSAYRDFVMNPWWDVVVADWNGDISSSRNPILKGNTEEKDSERELDTKTPSPPCSIESGLDELKRTVRDICEEGSKLLSAALEVQQKNQEMDQSDRIPPISAYDMSIRIGACEQNAMGIRQRNPLCWETITDSDLRQRQHDEITLRLHKVGFLSNEEDCDDSCDGINLNEGQQQPKTSYTKQHEFKAEHYESDGNDKQSGEYDIEVDDQSQIDTDTGIDTERNGTISGAYSVDDIAGILADLEFDVSDPVRDDLVTTANSPSYAANGDDYDYLFPPFDGTAMFAIACKMNHSCDPNVILMYNKRNGFGSKHPLTAYCVALKDIQPGEELTISYIELHNQSYDERQKQLANYGFVCKCSRCIIELESIISASQPMEISGIAGSILDSNTGPFGSDDDEKDVMLESDEQDREEIKSALSLASNEDMGNETLTNGSGDGESKLQKMISHKETLANHSHFGSIPLPFLAPVSAYILHISRTVLKDLNENNKDRVGASRDEVLIILVNQCIEAVHDRDFSMCTIVGSDLSATLYYIMKSKGGWTHPCYRHAFWCSTLTATIGYGHNWNFLEAIEFLDKGITMGLPVSSEQRIQPFFRYIETHAKEMAMSPYSPYYTCPVPNYAQQIEVLKREGLSCPICHPIEESFAVPSLEVFTLEFLANSKPVVIRNYASDWPAMSKWHLFHYFAYEHGHRLVPIELGSMMNHKNVMTQVFQSFRFFIETYLVPSTARICWSLLDAKEGTEKESMHCRVAYLAQNPLLSQIPSLELDLNMKPSLCGEFGPIHVNVWMGTGGTRTPLHYDTYDNLLIQIVGVTYVRVYDQDQTPNLYCRTVTTSCDIPQYATNYDVQGNISDVDCEQEDFNKHPKAVHAKFTEVMLLPGDCLFKPAQTWHYVRSLSTSISVNFWF